MQATSYGNGVTTLASANLPFTMGGGTLSLGASGAWNPVWTLGNITLNAGASAIIISGGNVPSNPGANGSNKLNLGSMWSRQAGGTLFVDLSAQGGVTSLASTPSLTNGVLGYALILNTPNVGNAGIPGIGFATVSGGNVVRYTGATSLVAASNSATTNFATNGSLTLSGPASANSLSIDTTYGGTLDLGASGNILTLTTGGLVLSGANGAGYTITDGQLTSTGPDLILFQYGSAPLKISAAIVGANALTVGGPGVTALAGVNTYTGGTFLNAGTLAINSTTALGTVAGTLTIGGGALDNTSGSAITLANNNPQTWSSDLTFVGSNSLNLGTGAVSLGSGNGSAVTGARTVTVNASTLTVGGVISNSTTTTGLIKAGAGTLDLTAANTYSGTTTVNGGTLLLDFSTGATTTNILYNGLTQTAGSGLEGLTLGGGTLALNGVNAATNNSQAFNGLTLNPGASGFTITDNNAGNNTLVSLGAITRNIGGTVNFGQPANTISATDGYTTGNGTASTILTDANGAAYATVGGSDWAAKDATDTFIVGGSTLAGFYTASTASALSGNADVASGINTTLSAATTNLTSLRFNQNQATTITATGKTLTTGGILVTTAVATAGSNITGGTLEGVSGGDLVIFQNSAQPFTISSLIANNTSATGLTKCGSGILTLGGANTYTGTTTIDGGTLAISADANMGTGPLSLAGGNLEVTGVTNFTSTRNVVLTAAGGAFNIDAGQTWTENGTISGAAGVLIKTGLGQMTISSGTLASDGGIIINGGMLYGAYTAFPYLEPLTMGGGSFSVSGHASYTQTETFGNLTLTAGGNTIVVNGNGVPSGGTFGVNDLLLGNIWTRNAGATLIDSRGIE